MYTSTTKKRGKHIINVGHDGVLVTTIIILRTLYLIFYYIVFNVNELLKEEKKGLLSFLVCTYVVRTPFNLRVIHNNGNKHEKCM